MVARRFSTYLKTQVRRAVLSRVGGSGAGIVRYDSEDALADAVARGAVDLGIDGTALVQEAAPLRDGHIGEIGTKRPVVADRHLDQRAGRGHVR